jgi:exosortase/archaeosortase family protein
MPKVNEVWGIGLSAVEFRAWALAVAAAGYWGNLLRSHPDSDATNATGMLDRVIDNGAFPVGAWILIALHASKAPSTTPASWWVIGGTIAACLLAMLPANPTTALLLIVLAIQYLRYSRTEAARGIALLLLALAGGIIWTSSIFLPLHALIAVFDSRAVWLLLRLGGIPANGYANLVDSGTAGRTVEILAPCASSFQLGVTCLAFIATMFYLGEVPKRRHLGWLVASLLAAVALNEARLFWMVAHAGGYTWLHDGAGKTLYVVAATALAILFPALAARGKRRTCAYT